MGGCSKKQERDSKGKNEEKKGVSEIDLSRSIPNLKNKVVLVTIVLRICGRAFLYNGRPWTSQWRGRPGDQIREEGSSEEGGIGGVKSEIAGNRKRW